MLPKTKRFTAKDLDNLRKLNPKHTKLNTPYGFFVIYEGSKKGIFLSKKNFKHAVERNRLKRLFYNVFLEVSQECKEIEKYSLILHAKKAFNKKEIMVDIMKILKK